MPTLQLMAGQLNRVFISGIVNFYYAYLLLKKIRELNDLRQRSHEVSRGESGGCAGMDPEFGSVPVSGRGNKTQLCCKYILKMSQNDHSINFIKPRTATSGHSYNLRASDNNRNIV